MDPPGLLIAAFLGALFFSPLGIAAWLLDGLMNGLAKKKPQPHSDTLDAQITAQNVSKTEERVMQYVVLTLLLLLPV